MLLEIADFLPLILLALAVSAALAGGFLAFNAAFQHANLKTLHWLGCLIQRPESHAVHHARGVHRWNYADLPLWDLLFGTLRNPRGEVPAEARFYAAASARLGAMLAFRKLA